MPKIRLPDKGITIQFPDDMSKEDIQRVIKEKYYPEKLQLETTQQIPTPQEPKLPFLDIAKQATEAVTTQLGQKPVISAARTLAEQPTTPIINLPPVEDITTQQENPKTALAYGVTRGIANMTTPENVAIIASLKASPAFISRIAGLAFGLKGLETMFKASPELEKAYNEKRWADVGELGATEILGALMLYGGAKSAFPRKAPLVSGKVPVPKEEFAAPTYDIYKEGGKPVTEILRENLIERAGQPTITPETTKVVEPAKEVVLSVAKELEPLVQEARKFKSAEDFIKSKHSVWHDSKIENLTFDTDSIDKGTGLSYGAYWFSEKPGYFKVSKGFEKRYYLDIKNPATNEEYAEAMGKLPKELYKNSAGKNEWYRRYFNERGKDGVILDKEHSKDGNIEYAVFDPSKIKTKSQLIDIYNQAVGITPTKEVVPSVAKEPLIEQTITLAEQKAAGMKPLKADKQITEIFKENMVKEVEKQLDLVNADTSVKTKLPFQETVPIAEKNMTPQEKYAFNINKEQLKLGDKGNEILDGEVKSIILKLTENKGEPLTDIEIETLARGLPEGATFMLRKESVLEIAALRKSRNKISDIIEFIEKLKNQNIPGMDGYIAEKSAQLHKDLVNTIEVVSSWSTHLGRAFRSLQDRSEFVSEGLITESAKMTKLKLSVITQIMKVEKNSQALAQRVELVDWSDARSIAKFYREYFDPTIKEIVTAYRYANMLSSPKTHIINASTNFLQTVVAPPVRLFTEGINDGIRHIFTGKGKEHFIKEASLYVKGLLVNIPEAFTNMFDVIKGKKFITHLDIKRMPLFTKGGIKHIAEEVYTFPTKLLEAGDIFYHTLGRNGYTEAIKYNLAKRGIERTPEQIDAMARSKSMDDLFRTKLFPEGQGKLYNVIDDIALAILKLRKKNPIINILEPFVQTVNNIGKKGLEYTPLGFTSLGKPSKFMGETYSAERIAKAEIGSIIMLGGAYLYATGRLIGSAPENPKEREIFYNVAHKLPNSFYIGGKYYQFERLGPVAYPLFMTIAIAEGFKKNKETNVVEKTVKALKIMAQYYAKTSYMDGLSTAFKALSSSNDRDAEKAMNKLIVNSAGQFIPYTALLRWTRQLADDIYRKPEGIKEEFFNTMPILSEKVKPYIPIQRKQLPFLNIISPVSISAGTKGAASFLKMIQKTNEIKNQIKAEAGR